MIGLLLLLIHADTLWAARRVWELTAGGQRELTEEESYNISRETYNHLGPGELVIRAAVVVKSLRSQAAAFVLL